MTTQCGYSSRSEPSLLHHFFEQIALEKPLSTAVDVPPGSTRPARRTVTYADLKLQSDGLAWRIRPAISAGSVAAVLLPRDSECLYIAQLAILKAGAAHLCIDPSFPDDQIRDILADSGAVVLLTDAMGNARAGERHYNVGQIIDVMDDIWLQHDGAAPPPEPEWLCPESPAYLIYTSGTTGRPKGVVISHSSIVSLVRSDIQEFALSPDSRVAQGSSAAYDSSVEETWLALAAGATLVVMDDEAARSGPDLIEWLRRERVSVLCPPPTLLRATGCADPEKELPDLKLLYVGGEALPRDVADRWAMGRRLVNGYGPTECTVTALRADVLPSEPITIGWPVSGMQAWVLDDSLNLVPDGEPGELCLGGVGLALGYHNRPELNTAKFPLHSGFGRIYRTGDLVHRQADGAFVYHGRIDSQVKLRGYRIELEAIETCLSECEGVREAACRLQGEGVQQTLAAFIVPEDDRRPPRFDDLMESLSRSLPSYMVPGLFGTLADLPKSIGGKLKRNDLPHIDVAVRKSGRTLLRPRNTVESNLAGSFCSVLAIPGDISVDDDFFKDLGGSSLQAAQLISRLREDTSTASITVRDLYEARTVARLALRTTIAVEVEQLPELPQGRSAVSSVSPTLVQILWLWIELLVATGIAYVTAYRCFPWLLDHLSPAAIVLLALPMMILGLMLYCPISILAAVAIKRILIGRYQPQRVPVWSNFYIRNWIVQQVVRIVPWNVLAGTEFQIIALRALGAKIGHHVHIHRGVNLLMGGWDLLDIGDEVSIGQDATVRMVEFDDGQIVVGSVSIGDGVTLEVRSGVGPNTHIEPGAYLTALSSLPSGSRIPCGERWDGIPAQPAGPAPSVPQIPNRQIDLSPLAFGTALITAQCVLWTVLALPPEMLLVAAALRTRLKSASISDVLLHPGHAVLGLLLLIALLCVSLPVALVFEALVARGMGSVPEGVISRWSLAYIRIWLKAELVDYAGFWLSGAMFWPTWLRVAGMKVGRDCEISTIIDVIPELVEIGDETFLADGIYLGGPRVHRGTVSLARVKLNRNTFLGNHVVISGGQRLPEDILLGVCTVSDDQIMRPGTSWFGHPPFELPRREIVECERRLTHDPTPLRYMTRVFWECLRFTLPILPSAILIGWFEGIARLQAFLPGHVLFAMTLPLFSLACAGIPCVVILLLKWSLLGRVRPGNHPLWSCWCSRWDFLYVAWGFYARRALTSLEGTEMLIWYLRAMGMKLGKGVVLGGGFTQVVDPDMIEIEDGATVSAMFQAHTFEDRVLKIDRIHIGRQSTLATGSVPFYGAVVGAQTYVAPHSVVMKHERLLPGMHYEGAPTKPQGSREIQH